MKTLSKKISISIVLLALMFIMAFALSACNTPEGKVLYKLTNVSFDVENTSTEEDPEEFPTRASEDVTLNSYKISAAFNSVYDSQLKLLPLASCTDGTDKLCNLPRHTISSKPLLYFFNDATQVSLNIQVQLKTENSTSSNLYQTSSDKNGFKYYSVGNGLEKLELQQDGSYLLKIKIFSQTYSYNRDSFYNTTYIILRFEKAN